jgi:hypothetical protein
MSVYNMCLLYGLSKINDDGLDTGVILIKYTDGLHN